MSIHQISIMTHSILQIRRAFGIFFINISILVFSGSIVSEIAFRNDVPLYYYVMIWIIISSLIFGLQFKKFKLIFSSIRQRMINSTKWSLQIKTINGLCSALPFASIAFFPEFLQDL